MAWPKGRSRKQVIETSDGSTPEVEKPVAKKSFSKGSRWTMKAGNNWETASSEEANIDRFHIPKGRFPEEMDLQWCTETIFGQELPQRMAGFQRAGWTPVHTSDFDNMYKGQFTAADYDGYIKQDGMVLCARPIQDSIRARKREEAKARQVIALKEQAFTGGGMDASGADHPSAKQFNHIRRSVERIDIPKD